MSGMRVSRPAKRCRSRAAQRSSPPRRRVRRQLAVGRPAPTLPTFIRGVCHLSSSRRSSPIHSERTSVSRTDWWSESWNSGRGRPHTDDPRPTARSVRVRRRSVEPCQCLGRIVSVVATADPVTFLIAVALAAAISAGVFAHHQARQPARDGVGCRGVPRCRCRGARYFIRHWHAEDAVRPRSERAGVLSRRRSRRSHGRASRARATCRAPPAHDRRRRECVAGSARRSDRTDDHATPATVRRAGRSRRRPVRRLEVEPAWEAREERDQRGRQVDVGRPSTIATSTDEIAGR